MSFRVTRTTQTTSYNKKVNTTYICEVDVLVDDDTGETKRRKRVVGKIDKETGKIVPTGSRGRPRTRPLVPKPQKATIEVSTQSNETITLTKNSMLSEAYVVQVHNILKQVKLMINAMEKHLTSVKLSIEEFDSRWDENKKDFTDFQR